MRIWVDADACPREIKELLFRTAQRRQVRVTLVANQAIYVPSSPYVDAIIVPGGANMADRRIVEQVQPGELVVTADIPLAADVIARGGHVLDTRGEVLDEHTIGERLAMRDLLDQLRGGGLTSGGPASFGLRDRQNFANGLDRWLAKRR